MNQLAGNVPHSMIRWFSWVLAIAFAFFLIAGVAGASADTSFCTFGSGAGQCVKPSGVAVDRSTGHVYVADAGNDRVNVFDENGAFLTSFGVSGSAAGQLDTPSRIAIDNDPTSPAYRDVYIVDANLRVQRFSPSGEFILSFGSAQVHSAFNPVAVGSGGTIYLGDEFNEDRIVKFAPSGTLLGASILPAGDGIGGIAVDSGGYVYAMRGGPPDVIQKYELTEPTATLLDSFDAGANTRSLAVDAADHLYASQIFTGSSGFAHLVTERDSSGNVVSRFGYGENDFNLNGLAVGATGDLFGSEEYVGAPTPGNRVIRIDQPPPGPLACCLQAIPGNTKATLKATLNPEGKATTYRIDYLDAESFKSGGFSNPATQSTAEIPAGSDFSLHGIEAQAGCAKPQVPPQASCLKPATEYRYRLVATNEDGKSEAEGSFTTRPPFEVLETYSTEVGTDAARLHAVVNPLGIPTTGYFEYVDDAAFQADVGEGGDGFSAAARSPDVAGGQSPIDLGEGEAGKAISTQLSSLSPATTYHYRVVASDSFVTAPGPEHTFTTFPAPSTPTNSCPNAVFRTGPSATLPACRAYEMVSPVDKNGGDIKVLPSPGNYPARLDQSSADGESFAYSAATAFADAVSAPWTSAYRATRKDGVGWSTQAISPPRESKSLITDVIKLDSQYKAFSPDLAEGWLLQDTNPPLDSCAPSDFLNLYRRDVAGGTYEALTTAKPSNQTVQIYVPELQGFSADQTHAVFRANGKLTPTATGTTDFQLYEHIRGEGCGELRLVSLLPNGKASTARTSLGTGVAFPRGEGRINTVSNAVSADGSRIFWTASVGSCGGVECGPLYVRIGAAQTLQVAAGQAEYWTAAADGSRAIYSVGNELFEFDVDKALASEPATTLIATGSQGVVAASEDVSRLYFVSEEALGGEGEAGKPNLFLREDGKGTRLIATLYGGDSTLPGGDLNSFFSQVGYALARRVPASNGVRVSEDGAHLAFVSFGSPTGYDNHDAADGLPSLEVYLYDTESDQVSCISCNPSGARPEARKVTGGPEVRRVSAQMAAGENQFFFPRALSADGNHLFFESFEALLPRDTNGKEDVYEWQRAGGEGECKATGAELYVPSAGGCLSLISSGQSPLDSELADASPDGSDVFIRTASSLLPQDPGLVDVYDARINGGLPQPPAPPAACEGEACQGPLTPPNDPTPASSAFEGAGNVVETPAKKKAHKKQKAAKKKHAKKHKRAKHNRKAGR